MSGAGPRVPIALRDPAAEGGLCPPRCCASPPRGVWTRKNDGCPEIRSVAGSQRRTRGAPVVRVRAGGRQRGIWYQGFARETCQIIENKKYCNFRFFAAGGPRGNDRGQMCCGILRVRTVRNHLCWNFIFSNLQILNPFRARNMLPCATAGGPQGRLRGPSQQERIFDAPPRRGSAPLPSSLFRPRPCARSVHRRFTSLPHSCAPVIPSKGAAPWPAAA